MKNSILLHAAINLRSEGIFDDVKGFQIPVDFRTSKELVNDPHFMYGYCYPGEVEMQVRVARANNEPVTKETYKNWSRQYRLYVRESSRRESPERIENTDAWQYRHS